jgi:stress response protein YsnF
VLSERELSAAIGTPAYDADGDKIGTVEHFFVDDRTGAPTWVAVTTRLFGSRHSVVPAVEATFVEGALRLPVRKETVKSAPQVADGGHLDPGDEQELRRHYGLGEPADTLPGGAATGDHTGRHAAPDAGDAGSRSWSAAETSAVPVGAVHGGTEPPGPVAVPEHEVAAAHATATDGGMTRSEEQLRVSTQHVPVARVRLVKYVVTEEVQVTVPIRREEVRLEEIPVGDEPAGGTGESLLPAGAEPGTGLPDEIVLHAERPVVGVEVVPVERVRLRTDVVTGEERISERVQREQIVVDES